jgi:hypothetical protein
MLSCLWTAWGLERKVTVHLAGVVLSLAAGWADSEVADEGQVEHWNWQSVLEPWQDFIFQLWWPILLCLPRYYPYSIHYRWGLDGLVSATRRPENAFQHRRRFVTPCPYSLQAYENYDARKYTHRRLYFAQNTGCVPRVTAHRATSFLSMRHVPVVEGTLQFGYKLPSACQYTWAVSWKWFVQWPAFIW